VFEIIATKVRKKIGMGKGCT